MSEFARAKMGHPGKPHHRPSKLRNEIHQESTDDERAPEDSYVQAPDSDTVISEAQFEQLEHGVGDEDGMKSDALSPNSKALLEKCEVSKNRNPVDSVPFQVNFLSKSPPLGDEQTSPGFKFDAFAPKRPTAPASTVSNENPAPHPVSESQFVNVPKRQVVGDVSKVSSEPYGKLHQTRPRLGKHTKRTVQSVASTPTPVEVQMAIEPVPHNPDKVSVDDRGEPTSSAPQTQRQMGTDEAIRPSAEPSRSPHPDTPRTRPRVAGPTGKKGKKKFRKTQAAQPHAGPWLPRSDHVKGSVSQTEPSNVSQDILNVVPGSISSSTTPAVEDKPTSPAPEQTRASPEVARELESQNYGTSQPEASGVKEHHPLPTKAPPLPSRRETPEAVLHEVSSRSGASRVAKPQNQTRKAGAPRALAPKTGSSGQRPAFPSHFETALAGLRMAYYADQVRAEHSHTSKVEENDAIVSALQEANGSHRDRIKALEATEKELRANLEKQSNQSKGLQKFVKGLGNDYERLKGEVKIHHDKCTKVLNEKVEELKQERAALISDFSATVDALDKGRRTMKEVLDDCYVRLRIIDSKKKDLVKELSRKDALIEEEKRRRTDLEQQITTSFKTVLCRLEDNNEALLEKLRNIQASFENAAVDESRDACLKECVDAVQSLQATSLLTIKDVQKAEGMLHYVHDSINSKFENLSISVDTSRFPTENVQGYIRNQLQGLKTEILKHDEINAKYQEARQSSEHLTKQLEAQKQRCEELDEQVKVIRQSESDLRSRSTQLPLELDALKDQSRDLNFEPSELEQEMTCLRAQLRKAEDDLQAAVEKLDNAGHLRQVEESAAAQWRKSALESEAKLAHISRKDKKVKERLAEMRAQMSKECRKTIQEKEATLGNDLHRVTRERDEKEKLLQTTSRELDATRGALQRTQQQLRETEAEVNDLRKEKFESESELKKAQRALRQNSISLSELANLREELRLQTDACQVKENELITIREEHAAMQNQTSALQESVEKAQNQISEHRSTIESICRELDSQLSEQREKSKTELQEAQDKIASLQRRNQDLESSLEQARQNGDSSVKDVQAKFSREKGKLREEVAELQNSKRENELEMQRIRNDAEDEMKRQNKKFRNESRDLERRLSQSDAALNGAEAKARGYQAEKEIENQKRKEVTEKKFGEVCRQADRVASQKSIDQNKIDRRSLQSQGSQPSMSQGNRDSQVTCTPPTIVQVSHPAKAKKKVNRQDNSVLSVGGPSCNPRNDLENSMHASQTQHEEISGSFDEPEPMSLVDDLGSREQVDEHGLPIIDPQLAVVPERQEESRPSMSFEQFNRSLGRVANQTRSSSSLLFDVDTNAIEIPEYEQLVSPVVSPGFNDRPLPRELLHNSNVETPSRTSHELAHDARSLSRPRSQANTASRMVPAGSYMNAPPHVKKHGRGELSFLDQGSQDPTSTARSNWPQQSLPQRSNKMAPNNTGSPDYVHRPSSGSHRVTYGHPSGRPTSSNTSHGESGPRTADNGSGHKRKSSVAKDGRNVPSKRVRDSSQPVPPSMPRSSHQQVLSSSSMAYRSEGQMRSSARAAATSSSGRFSRAPRTKSERYDLRFSQELGGL